MAVGFNPKHSVYFPLEDLNEEQFIAIALDAASTLKWNIGTTTRTSFLAYTGFSMSSYGEEVSISLENNFVTVESRCTGNQLFDWGKNKANVARFIKAYDDLKATATPEMMTERYASMQSVFIKVDENDPIAESDENEKTGGFLSLFIPRKGFMITPILVDVNILIFILMAISGVSIINPDGQSLLNWGANYLPLTLNGQAWRLLTACFIHIGVMHLLLNMYALVYIGILLEPIIGSFRFASAYLLTGIAASVCSLWWHEDPTVSAGASGAIFGMYGVFLALLTTSLIEKSMRNNLLSSIAIFVGYNLLNGLKGGIDNAAHIGGLISGILAGYLIIPAIKNTASPKWKYGTVGALALLVLIASITVFVKAPRDMVTFNSVLSEFSKLEEDALKAYRVPENTPDDRRLSMLRDESLPDWQKSVKLMSGLQKLDLPETHRSRSNKLVTYSVLRVKQCMLMIKTLEENTDKYANELTSVSKDIEMVISELSR